MAKSSRSRAKKAVTPQNEAQSRRLRTRILNEFDAWREFWRNSDNRGAFPERSYVAEHVLGRPGSGSDMTINGLTFSSFAMHPILECNLGAQCPLCGYRGEIAEGL